MAHAEVGDFDFAVRYEEKALALRGVKANDSKRLQAHLDSFKQHRPFLPRSLNDFFASASLVSVACALRH
jgi:hypothetical protein